ncbi:potential tail fiber or connector protein [Klebsiella phage 05F01]|nr:potential tail fiber or connector protein [Klebsiella phage 05F01]
MAQPTYYPLWATEDTTLPNTDQTNKIRPKTTLREIGWDKGQIPSAEEFNWLFNNMYQWIYYLNEEALPTYLPINGTSLSFTGDITGTATWNGDSATSVELSSATLNAATSNPIVNTLVKRDSGGGFGALQNMYGYAPAGQNFDYRIYDQANSNVQKGSFAWGRSGDVITIYKGTPTAKTAEIVLYNGRVELTSPRSRSTQGTDSADLTRKDYVDNKISSNISTLDSTLRSYIDSKSTASFAANGYWKDVNTGTIIQWGSVTLPTTSRVAQTSASVTFPITFPNTVYSISANPKLNQMNLSTGNITVLACVNGTTTGFNLWGDSNSGQDFGVAQPCYWIAIGR